MGWKASQRASLSALRRQGVVAVRYEKNGCDVELEVLPDCIGDGDYVFSPYVANESKLARDRAELRAKLPLGAAELGGHLAEGWSLRTDYRLAGMLSLPPGKRYAHDALRGLDCDRATHVVARIYLGGFALAVGESRTIAAAATLFGAGVSGEHLAQTERLASEGDADGCKEAQREGVESPRCDVPLRLGLLPLGTPIDGQAAAPDPATGLAPLATADEHGCIQQYQVYNGERCVSVRERRPTCAEGQYYREDTNECAPCHPKIIARGCPRERSAP